MTSKKTIHSDIVNYELQTPVPQLQNTDFETDICIADSVYPVVFKNSSEKNSLEKAVKENRNLNVHQSAYYGNYKAEMSECDSPDLSTNQTSNESKPIEPYSKLAFTIFLISIISLIAALLLGGTFIILLVPGFTGLLTSIILSIIGFIRILYHKNKFRGLGRAISALLLSSFTILSALYVWIMSSIVY